ncbi:unnamed protein product [Strongylus vulgaris]|uniref:DUF5648 domain-containing protein n=1 Tax=Strongylus vulgaris TaxID=40348 RepID=A0A3P7IRB6_STRVU|nr:unnamed protein product [Strongylus vulgaris]
MITVNDYEEHKSKLVRHCPELVPLFTVLHDKANTQKMTTNQAELDNLIENGWREIEKVGYCVNGKKCGATKALRELRETAELGDIIYTTTDDEFNSLNNKGSFQGSGTTICYVW